MEGPAGTDRTAVSQVGAAGATAVSAGDDAAHPLSANVADIAQAHKLLHGKEDTLSGDSRYTGLEKCAEMARKRKLRYLIAEKPSKLKQIKNARQLQWTKRWEHTKGSLRAKVDHPFRVIKPCGRGSSNTARDSPPAHRQKESEDRLASVLACITSLSLASAQVPVGAGMKSFNALRARSWIFFQSFNATRT
ncbi:IS5 family transposase [Xanthomonas campestris]|nr:IS5 family transposase [Xanthomonas campestris]